MPDISEELAFAKEVAAAGAKVAHGRFGGTLERSKKADGSWVTEADKAGMWTLQTSIFPENRASLALHHSAGYRTLAVRTRIAQLDGVWRDTVLLERRSEIH